MAAIALIAVGVLASLVFVLFGALIELYKDVRQLRDAVGILDRPLKVEMGLVRSSVPSTVGLPSPLDTATAAVVLFLSEQCATCRSLAAGLNSVMPAGLWIVLEARSAVSADRFLDLYALSEAASGGTVIVDFEGAIARQIGVDTTPVALVVENGRLSTGTTVPSSRYLKSILPTPVVLSPRDSRDGVSHGYQRTIPI